MNSIIKFVIWISFLVLLVTPADNELRYKLPYSLAAKWTNSQNESSELFNTQWASNITLSPNTFYEITYWDGMEGLTVDFHWSNSTKVIQMSSPIFLVTKQENVSGDEFENLVSANLKLIMQDMIEWGMLKGIHVNVFINGELEGRSFDYIPFRVPGQRAD